jgi:hypothetical protein
MQNKVRKRKTHILYHSNKIFPDSILLFEAFVLLILKVYLYINIFILLSFSVILYLYQQQQ